MAINQVSWTIYYTFGYLTRKTKISDIMYKVSYLLWKKWVFGNFFLKDSFLIQPTAMNSYFLVRFLQLRILSQPIYNKLAKKKNYLVMNPCYNSTVFTFKLQPSTQ